MLANFGCEILPNELIINEEDKNKRGDSTGSSAWRLASLLVFVRHVPHMASLQDRN